MTNRRKIVSMAAAGVFAASIIVTGTLAWQHMNQRATNELQGVANPGGRLHDYFDGRNKDIFVENFGDPNSDGVPIFVRVQLREYMETGPDAGTILEGGARPPGITSLPYGYSIGDPTSWLVHNYGIMEENNNRNHKVFHQYWKWSYGGQRYYMPTFNRNKDSLAADRNGTYEGADGDRTQGDRYDDYVDWQEGQTKTANLVYDADTNDVDEGEEAIEGENIRTEESIEHTAKQTLNAEVLSMEEWKNKESPIGNFWVYDEDGWVYWAAPLQPGEATGILLSAIAPVDQPHDEWYYSIYANAQFCTVDDWTRWSPGISPAAKALLEKAADRLPTIEKVEIQGGRRQNAKVGEAKTFSAIVDVKNPTRAPAETYVTWSIDPQTPALVGNRLTPTQDMVGKRYKLTATSAFDPKKKDTADVLIYPGTTSGSVTGSLDGKQYINLGDNTFREVIVTPDGQELGPLICGGADRTIGNGDDIAAVVELKNTHPVYGSKFIGPGEGDVYLGVGPDKILGTTDDIKLIGDPVWPEGITSILADAIEITASGNNQTVKLGSTEKMTAKVTRKGKPIGVQDVTWTLRSSASSVSINSASGELTVGSSATVGGSVTIKATSKEMPSLSKSKVLLIAPWDWSDIPQLDPSASRDIRIDGIDWWLLVKDGDRALITPNQNENLMKRKWDESMPEKPGPEDYGNPHWETSDLRTYLNTTWLDQYPTVKEKALNTKYLIRTESGRTQSHATKFKEITDKVFLPSVADFTSTTGSSGYSTYDPREYTYGASIIYTIRSSMVGYQTYWTRVPYDISYDRYKDHINTGYVSTTLSVRTNRPNDASVAVMPLIWIKMPNYIEASESTSSSSSSSSAAP